MSYAQVFPKKQHLQKQDVGSALQDTSTGTRLCAKAFSPRRGRIHIKIVCTVILDVFW